MVSLHFVEVFWRRGRFAYCSGFWVCCYNRSLLAWSCGVGKGVKTREEGILVADGTSGKSLVGWPYGAGSIVMLVPQNAGDGSLYTDRDLLSMLLVRLGYDENQGRGSDMLVATFCVGIDVLIKWVLSRGCCNSLLSVLLSNKVQVKICLMLVHRNLLRMRVKVVSVNMKSATLKMIFLAVSLFKELSYPKIEISDSSILKETAAARLDAESLSNGSPTSGENGKVWELGGVWNWIINKKSRGSKLNFPNEWVE
ncbi:hypothetical protein YC2023_094434 [Brassica napus]